MGHFVFTCKNQILKSEKKHSLLSHSRAKSEKANNHVFLYVFLSYVTPHSNLYCNIFNQRLKSFALDNFVFHRNFIDFTRSGMFQRQF